MLQYNVRWTLLIQQKKVKDADESEAKSITI